MLKPVSPKPGFMSKLKCSRSYLVGEGVEALRWRRVHPYTS